MRKKFKARNNKKIKKIIIYIFYIIVFILIFLLLKNIANTKIMNLDPINLLKTSNNYNNVNLNKYLNEFSNKISGIRINEPITILSTMNVYKNNGMKMEIKEKKENIMYLVKNEKKNEPLVYIYNSHPTEQYEIDNNNIVNIEPNVVALSYYFEKKLEELGINTIVEQNNVSEILKQNNWDYDQSYPASRIGLEKAKKEYPSIKIFIDLHRDALNKEYSTTTINDKNYSKIMLLVGMDHESYLENYAFASSINEKINEKYPTLSRGIMEGRKPGMNGVYNQDISPNVVLFEIGGHMNTINESMNTIDAMAQVIKEKINENS